MHVFACTWGLRKRGLNTWSMRALAFARPMRFGAAKFKGHWWGLNHYAFKDHSRRTILTLRKFGGYLRICAGTLLATPFPPLCSRPMSSLRWSHMLPGTTWLHVLSFLLPRDNPNRGESGMSTARLQSQNLKLRTRRSPRRTANGLQVMGCLSGTSFWLPVAPYNWDPDENNRESVSSDQGWLHDQFHAF